MTIGKWSTVKVELTNKILTLTLNRPEKRNALNPSMLKEILEILEIFKVDDEVFGFIFTGSGDAFCSGADLDHMQALKSGNYDQQLTDSRQLKDFYWSVYTYPKPVIGAVKGAALAGGCGLVTVFDYILSDRQAVFGYPEVKIGFMAAIVSVFLSNRVGQGRAKELLLSGKTINADTAERYGLINEIIGNAEDLIPRCKEFMTMLMKNAPAAMISMKQFMISQNESEMQQKLDRACELNARTRMLPEFNEGLSAFLEKRKPYWIKP